MSELRINEDSDFTAEHSNSNTAIIYDFWDGVCVGLMDIMMNETASTVDCLTGD